MFYEDRVGIFGICDFPRAPRNGSIKGQGNCGMTFPKEYLIGNGLPWLNKFLNEFYHKF